MACRYVSWRNNQAAWRVLAETSYGCCCYVALCWKAFLLTALDL
jgi:hypothetical protein